MNMTRQTTANKFDELLAKYNEYKTSAEAHKTRTADLLAEVPGDNPLVAIIKQKDATIAALENKIEELIARHEGAGIRIAMASART